MHVCKLILKDAVQYTATDKNGVSKTIVSFDFVLM